MRNYFGSVEDINDPLKMGRVKVRVHGVHSPSNNDINTDALPWANIMQPVTSAASKGVGFGGSGLIVGSEVVVIFRDAGTFQQPIVIGSLPGLYASDVEGSDISGNRESDMGRLATGNLIDETIVKTKKDTRVNTDNFVEPETQYGAQYPNNKTFTTPSGHVIELDDTPNKERIHVYHRSGTFIEIQPDGSIIFKNIGDSSVVNMNNKSEYVGGDEKDVVVGNSSKYVSGSVLLDSTGVIRFVATSGFRIEGNTIIDGNLNVTGTTTSDIDVVSGVVSLRLHTHSGVDRGNGLTDPPVGGG